jgi:hypothetical protein
MKYPLISRFHLSFYYWLFPFLSQPSFELVCYITAIKPCGKLLWKYKPRTFYENWINVYISLNKANLRWSSSGELFKYYTGNQMYINLYLFISHTNPKCNFMYILPSVIRKSQVCKNIREWTEEKKRINKTSARFAELHVFRYGLLWHLPLVTYFQESIYLSRAQDSADH